jgi:hypothetical protein
MGTAERRARQGHGHGDAPADPERLGLSRAQLLRPLVPLMGIQLVLGLGWGIWVLLPAILVQFVHLLTRDGAPGLRIERRGVRIGPGRFTPLVAWDTITDIEVVRRGNRREIRLAGVPKRILVPSDSRWLPDPDFDAKVARLRRRWERGRSSSAPSSPRPGSWAETGGPEAVAGHQRFGADVHAGGTGLSAFHRDLDATA